MKELFYLSAPYLAVGIFLLLLALAGKFFHIDAFRW